jgi:hypothetical protein
LLQADAQRALKYLKDGLLLAQKLGRGQAMATALYRLGTLAQSQADHAGGRSYYLESLAIYQALGDRRRASACEERLAEIAGHPTPAAAAGD